MPLLKSKSKLKRKSRPYKKKKYVRKPKQNFNMKVKRAITSMAEKKKYQISYSNQSVEGQVSPAGILALSFTPSQGTGQANRIGNRVKLLRVDVRGHVNVVSYTAATLPLMLVKVFLGRAKNSTGVSVTETNALMQSGNVATPLGPDVISYYRPFNRDVWSIYGYRNMKIGVASSVPAGTAVNNDFKNMQPFFFTLKPNMIVDFNDTSVGPQNYALFLGAVNIDYTGLGGDTDIVTEYHVECVFTYIDV